MRMHSAFAATCIFIPFAVGTARAQSPESPAPAGQAVPSDKEPPPQHKAFDVTVYGRVNVSFDLGNQELTGAPCITAAANPCAPPRGAPAAVAAPPHAPSPPAAPSGFTTPCWGGTTGRPLSRRGRPPPPPLLAASRTETTTPSTPALPR